jgi:lysophospholipase L1-like esterase
LHKRRGFLIIKMLVDIIPVITLIEDKAMRRFDGLCKSVLRYIFFASFFALLLAASGCVPNEDNAAQSEIPPPPTASLPVVEETPAPEASSENTPREQDAEEPAWSAPTTEPPAQTAVFSPDLDESEPVGDEFFQDAAFIGNSLLDGFRLHSGITCGDFYAYTSMTVMGVDVKQVVELSNGKKGTILQGMAQKEYGKVYILLGINEIYMEPDEFSLHYGKLVEKVKEIQPEADIYIMSLTPLGKEKSEGSDMYSLERLRSYNEALYNLAKEKECYYLDIYSALADDEGFLPKGDSTDGVHLVPDYYRVWLNYMKCHYASGEEEAQLQDS